MKSLSGKWGVVVIVIAWLTFYGCIRITEAEEWKYFVTDNTLFNYYFDAQSRINLNKDVIKGKVKGVCINKDLFLRDMKEGGRRMEGYEKYSHTIWSVEINCPAKMVRMTTFAEYDKNGKEITYSTDDSRKWAPVTPGSLFEILYRGLC